MEKAEVIKAFHLMWDNYPESAMLIDKKRNIIAANKVAPSTGCLLYTSPSPRD